MRVRVAARITAGFLLLTAALGIVGLQGTNAPPDDQECTLADNTPAKAPYLRLDSNGKIDYGFYTSTGRWQSAETAEGKIVLLYFWATWCQPCQRMMPWLNQLWHQYQKSDFAFTAIALDTEPETIEHYLQAKKFDLPYTFLPQELIMASDIITGVPTIYILSRQGKVLKKIEGITSQEQVENVLLEYMSK